jgi:hypothetical protein
MGIPDINTKHVLQERKNESVIWESQNPARVLAQRTLRVLAVARAGFPADEEDQVVSTVLYYAYYCTLIENPSPQIRSPFLNGRRSLC